MKYEPIIVIIIELECIVCAIDTCPSIKQNLYERFEMKSNNMYVNNKYDLFTLFKLILFKFLDNRQYTNTINIPHKL